ncbi:RidA family protein [Pedobacter sp. UBA4863]|uniref:RidA family protein n=1 Tax=Pedobacter sp. UBA4863 TaxID=1947060 RepID=UPI0025DAA311|nr:RidA family protein [Pedobacter sp. UBA4863]
MEITANDKYASLAKSLGSLTNESNEKPILKYGNFLHLQGKSKYDGKIGEDLSVKFGKAAAREIAMDFITTIQKEFGSMDKIKRVIGINGKINCSTDFKQHSYIINGCSELLNHIWSTQNNSLIASAITTDIWGETTSLEIEALFELNN